MAKKTFRCRVVTPTASLLDESAVHVQVPAWDGSMGVLPGRAALLARLGIGELRVDFADGSKGEGGSRSYFVDGGVARMAGSELMILAERAVPVESLDASAAQAELRAAEGKKPAAGSKDPGGEQAKINREKDSARTKVRLSGRKGGI
ncbi:MAG: F0F1 ATP synthase subunit epsilon [Phycisphaeraceae bacterium]|nr:MAG: F0F1 ATP synthase subunit epsilon [Phycisphaeraceae bacterium]